MIEIKNLNKYFNKGKKNEIHVINNTSLSLPDNGLVALLGESGCGKTTMLNAIGGLDTVKSGSIFINDEKITSRNVHSVDRIRNLSVGYIFQDYKLIDDMTVFENVALALKMVGISDKKEVRERVEYVLEKTGILRYRYRPASTLSGGERQRVGIARALVKNPDIILADEPTGNLDSKNSVEIMNIIKTISKNRLVILVTHERNLAEFYASRIVELVDGEVVKDYENNHNNELDYEIDNVFYLKEFDRHERYKSPGGNQIDLYKEKEDPIKLNLIVRNGNIYIQSEKPINIEVIDENSSIEVVDDFKKNINKESIDSYDFDMDKVGNQALKKKYSSMYKPFSEIFAGFKKVFSFTLLKKLLFVGFVLTGVFVMVSLARVGAVMHVEDKDFVEHNKNYVSVEKPSMTVDEYLKLEQVEGVEYMLPTTASQTLVVKLSDYFQTQDVAVSFKGSLTAAETLKESNLKYGQLPKNSNEIVIDTIVLDNFLESQNAKMAGALTVEDVLYRNCELSNGLTYKLVGIVDCNSPSIYAMKTELLKMLYYNNNGDDYQDPYSSPDRTEDSESTQLTSYTAYEGKYKLLKGGRLPTNDYEIIVNESCKDIMKLNKTIKTKVNGNNLKVVGYYTAPEEMNFYLCNDNTIKYSQILKANKFMLYTNDKSDLVQRLRNEGFKAEDTYEKSREKFDEDRKKVVSTAIVFSSVIMIISLVEMFLITRSSFLSRIKEVGTLRAIGAKKSDIYRMFIGEIFAIVTMTATPAMILTYIGIDRLSAAMEKFAEVFFVSPELLILGLIIIYAFNLLIGLIPVFNTMRKRPAEILARIDVD